LMRIISKFLVDFTLLLHFRHSYEVGGLLFCWLVVQNQAVCFVTAKLYLEYYVGGDGRGERVEGGTLWGVLLCLLGLFVFAGLTFVAFMDRKYLETFTSTTIGQAYAVEQYFSAVTDESKMDIFEHYEGYYESIEGELQIFIQGNWEGWVESKPDWFTDNMIASVPSRLLDQSVVDGLKLANGGARRKSSVVEMFGFGGGGGRGGFKVTPAPEGAEGDGDTNVTTHEGDSETGGGSSWDAD